MKPLTIPSRILQKTTLLNKDIISTKYNFEKTGSNGFITIDPSVISFQGFELNKINIIKFKIKNSSSIAQRINILPPSSLNFSIKFDKKGHMAPGMFQEVQVLFKPESHQYYYDTIKIHTESDNLVVPIHAYPVIPNLREIFPRLVDFGCIELNNEKSYNFSVVNKIPVDFEYEFTLKQAPQDLIIDPCKGVISKNSTTTIKFTFKPKQNITYAYQAELRVSQFDFDPLPIKIMGTGRASYLKGTLQKRPSSGQLKPLSRSIKPDEINLESLVNQADLSQPEIEVKEEKKRLKSSFSVKTSERGLPPKPQIKRQNFHVEQDEHRRTLEQNFLERFKIIQQTEKDKDIRFFQCIGDPNLTQQQIDDYELFRKNYKQQSLNQMEDEARHRYNLQLQRDLPIVDHARTNPEPTWDRFKNNDIKKRKYILNEFLRIASIVITRNRVQKRLDKVKNLLKDCKNRNQVKKLVQQDWLQAEYLGVGKKSHIKFTFEVNEHQFQKSQFPMQFETSNSVSNFRFNINSNTGFDEQLPINPINYCDSEVMGYQNWKFNQQLIYNPVESDRKMRTGAEEEYFIGEQFGPLEQEQELEILMNNKPIKAFEKPYEENSYQLISLHPKLKAYHKAEQWTETSPEFKLLYQSIDYQYHLSPKLDVTTKQDNNTLQETTQDQDNQSIKDNHSQQDNKSQTDRKSIQETKTPELSVYPTGRTFFNRDPLEGVKFDKFICSQPGLSANLPTKLEIDYYYFPKMQLTTDISNKQCFITPKPLPGVQKEDQFTDDDSDDQKPPTIPYTPHNDFLKNFEGQDSVIQEARKRGVFSKAQSIDEKICQGLSWEQQKKICLMPTRTQEYNKMIKNQDLKLLII